LNAQALSRYRVLDLGNVLAGPMVSQLMADMGAQVIKVETRSRLDGTRRGRPIVGEDIAGGDRGQWPELQPLFHCLNRNKLGVTVDLRAPRGLALVKELVAVSDVVISNSSPGVMDRLGLGYPVLRSIRPDVIVSSMPGAGETGPLRDVLAYASITSALSGLMGLIGYPPEGGNGDLAGQTQGPWCDVIASLTTLIAVLAALRHRGVTGRGQYIEVAHLEASVAMLGEAVMEQSRTRSNGGFRGTGHPLMAPHGNYPCKPVQSGGDGGEDRWVSITVATQAEWSAFRDALGHPPWAEDPRFGDAYSRSLHRAQLDRKVAGWTSQRTREEVAGTLQKAGIAAAPVMNIEDQFTDPHYRERGVFVESEHPRVGAEWLPGIPWQLSDTPGQVRRHAPLLGEHNPYVFRDLLGLPQGEYTALTESGTLT
jgi:benzylsuccinate CoA-transferase BbsF subunit